MKQHRNQRTFKDPVCGMELSRITAVEELEYHGHTYYFCAATCREAFEAQPEEYVPSHRQRGTHQK